MELALREAQARLAELVAAALDGERVVITKHGEPVVELCAIPQDRRHRSRQAGVRMPATRDQREREGVAGRLR